MIKEFETVVKQEIANHNNTIQKHQQNLNLFEKSIQEVHEKIDIQQKKTERNIYDIHLKLEEFKKYLHLFEELRSEWKTVIQSNTEIKENQDKYFQRFMKMFVSNDQFINTIHELKMMVESKIQDVDSCIKGVRGLLNEKQKEVAQRCGRIENQIETLPDVQPKLREDFKRMFDVYKVDCNGVLQLMEKHRKQMYILEKKFEFLDDEIKKLKDIK